MNAGHGAKGSSVNKYYELIKKLVQKHPGLADHNQKTDDRAVGHDLKLALINHEIQADLRDVVAVVRKQAVVKWVSPSSHGSPRLALEVEGRLITVYSYGKQLPELLEGQHLEVTLRPDSYGTYDVAEYHLPAQADAEAGA